MSIATDGQFTEEQIAASIKVDKWTASPEGEAWFADQIAHTHRLFHQHRADHVAWQEECRRRAADVLRSGHLMQPVAEGACDCRSPYPIEGIGPIAVQNKVQGKAVEDIDEPDARLLRGVLLGILEDRRLDLHSGDSWAYRRELLDSKQWVVFDYDVWVELPEETRGPLLVEGTEFAALSRTDRVAIAATLLLGLHANIMPDHDRTPDTGDFLFDICANASGEAQSGLRLIGLVNLIEVDFERGTPPPIHTELTASPTDCWIPPAGYIPTSKIVSNGRPVPPSTVRGWRTVHPAPFHKHPSTGEMLHPPEWVNARLAEYVPGRNLPGRKTGSHPG